MRPWAMALLALLVLSLVVAGLWWSPGNPANVSRGPGKANELHFVGFAEVNTLDPQKMSWLEDIRIAQCLFEPLVVFQLPQRTIEPGAAVRWEISPDRRTYTFHLRPEARWSNGDPVTAYDFAYAWRRALLPDIGAKYSQLLFVIDGAQEFYRFRSEQLRHLSSPGSNFSSPASPGGGGGREGAAPGSAPKTLDLGHGTLDIPPQSPAQIAWEQAQQRFIQTVGIQTPDAHTLVVRLRQPTPYFLELCAFATFMPVHRASVESFVTLKSDTGMLAQNPLWTQQGHLVSNGPYVLERRRFKRDLRLVANPCFWNRASVANSAIVQHIMPNVQMALIAYQRGQIDWIPDLPTAHSVVADLLARQRPDVHRIPMAGTYYYTFNCNPKLTNGSPNPLVDPRVRRALALTIDRSTIVNQVTRQDQPIALSFIPPGAVPGYDPPAQAGANYDPALARQMLAEAGYPQGKGLEGLSILYNTEGQHSSIAQQIKNHWEKTLGIVVTLEGVEKNIFADRLNKQDYTIARSGWFGDYQDPTAFLDKFISTNGNNNAGYRNPHYDRLLSQAADQFDPAQRLATLRQAESLLLADSPVAPIFQYVFIEMYDPQRLTNLHPNPWAFRRLEFVRIGEKSQVMIHDSQVVNE